VTVFDRFSAAARQVMTLADAEAERLRHEYLGPEHVLAGLARLPGSRAARILAASGLSGEGISAALDAQVAAGLLPGPGRNTADLLRTLGIDVSQVRQALEASFGPGAMAAASRRPAGRTWWGRRRTACSGPLAGKAMLAKRAFAFAAEEADRTGQPEVRPEHLLLGVLRDAKQPGRFSPRLRQARTRLGFPPGGLPPVRLIAEASGSSLDALQARVAAAVHAAG
jgi:ATP-dependent Clp protease ATP-binding subunit ClpA